jgi:hypothetical protein
LMYCIVVRYTSTIFNGSIEVSLLRNTSRECRLSDMANISSLIYKEIILPIIYSLIASSVLLPTEISHAQTRSIVEISHPNKVEF